MSETASKGSLLKLDPRDRLRALVRPGVDAVAKRISAWTFGKKLGVGFGVILLLCVIASSASVFAVRALIRTNQQAVRRHSEDLTGIANLRAVVFQEVSIQRGFLITRDALFLEDLDFAEDSFRKIFNALMTHARESGATEEVQLLDAVDHYKKRHQETLNRVIQMRKGRKSLYRISRFFNTHAMPDFDHLDVALDRYVRAKDARIKEAELETTRATSRVIRIIVFNVCIALLFACILAVVMSRALIQYYNGIRERMSARQDALAIISHDLKNPLTAVLMSIGTFTRQARKRKAMGETMSDDSGIVRTLESSVQRMRRLAQDLQDLQKIEAEMLPVEKSTVAVSSVIHEALSLSVPLAEGREVRVTSPALTQDWKLHCDSERILQVLLNILGNAVKFSPRGGTVELVVEKRETDTLFRISDSGPGIPADDIPKIFGRYWQASSTAKSGSGLGLYIAQGFVRAHGGEIWAESEAGKGSQFFFTVPDAPDMVTALRRGQASAENSVASS